MDNMTLTYLDFFGGAGGWSCGLEMAGFKMLGLYEINASACRTASYNLDGKVFEKDLTKFSVNEIKIKPDIVVGSPPCQGFSNEGYKKKEDPRNNLVGVFFDLVEKISPSVWVFENVPGFQRLYKGEFFYNLKKRLDKMKYHWDYFILNSADYGVPQKRQRFFAMGAKDFRPTIPPQSHFKNCDLFGLKKHRTLWEAISDLPEVGIGERNGRFHYDQTPKNDYQKWIRHSSDVVHNHTTQNHSSRVLEKIKAVTPGNYMNSFINRYEENNVAYCGGYRRAIKNEPSYTAYWTRGMTSIHPEQDRFLSPRECARIQSFPDKYVFKGASIENYTQVCNAVPPLMARAFGRYLLKTIKNMDIALDPIDEEINREEIKSAI
jgi:DNA (cytosine-5)-methyltransferase 1